MNYAVLQFVALDYPPVPMLCCCLGACHRCMRVEKILLAYPEKNREHFILVYLFLESRGLHTVDIQHFFDSFDKDIFFLTVLVCP